MKNRLPSSIVSVALLAAPCLPAQMRLAATPIDTARVADVLSGEGLPVQPQQISMPLGLSATVAEPELAIAHAEALQNGTLRLRVVCRIAGACQPFLAVVAMSGSGGSLKALTLLQPRASAAEPKQGDGDGRLLAGQNTTLLLEDDHMRITLPVVAIDTGLPGSAIRVRSLDHKQIFRAVVESRQAVRGALP